jgi:rod shape-determining protein MreB
MIVDIGGGTSEAAIIALNGVVRARASRVAGDELDESIVAFVRQEFNVAIGEPTAELMKIRIGSAWPVGEDDDEFAARGRDLASGMPTVVRVRAAQVRQAMAEPLLGIVEMVRQTLEDAPPELSGDIMERGLVLTGGGALLRGMDRLLEHETQMPVHVVENPLACVALGAGRALEDRQRFAEALARPNGSAA